MSETYYSRSDYQDVREFYVDCFKSTFPDLDDWEYVVFGHLMAELVVVSRCPELLDPEIVNNYEACVRTVKDIWERLQNREPQPNGYTYALLGPHDMGYHLALAVSEEKFSGLNIDNYLFNHQQQNYSKLRWDQCVVVAGSHAMVRSRYRD